MRLAAGDNGAFAPGPAAVSLLYAGETLPQKMVRPDLLPSILHESSPEPYILPATLHAPNPALCTGGIHLNGLGARVRRHACGMPPYTTNPEP